MGKKPCRYVLERRKLKDRPRKILNLEERVQAIRMYDEIPVYQRVASAFKCSWEQIKNVVANRKDILKYYASCQIIDVMKDDPKVVRHKKINFLGNCMYEYIKRAHFHKLQTVTDDVIRDRAMEFKDIIKIEKFFPNRAWIRDFKSVFNINLDHINQIIISRKPQRSLNCKDIITYCAKEVDNALSSQPSSSRNQMLPDVDANTIEIGDDGDNNDVEDDPLDGFEGDEDGDGEGGAEDDDTINENEEGPTINYGDYEDYHDESQEDVKPDVKELEDKLKNAKDSQGLLNAENIKEEPNDNPSILESCLLGIDKNSKSTFQKPPPKRPSSSSSSTSTTSKPLPSSVSNYEEALRLMRPLEEFAIFEEDFKAINLLNQLSEVYEKAKKRKRLE
ncbi:uncharacterized protein LOC111685592 isoform X2 [Lucilia cuprina]|uniref:uncharacterized protein LOC111685592 isoform X2 n=1 Tax=Lucilia cuprina TaxID=7375 RepID=UPI001F06549F|nr:uncharacterized protein LOC111685592 isoform X2 [Lucilia cuprina]